MMNVKETNEFFEEYEDSINLSRQDLNSSQTYDEVDFRLDTLDPTDVPDSLVEFANIRSVFSIENYRRSHNLFENLVPIDLYEVKHLEIKLHKKTFDRPDAFLHIELTDGMTYVVDLAS